MGPLMEVLFSRGLHAFTNLSKFTSLSIVIFPIVLSKTPQTYFIYPWTPFHQPPNLTSHVYVIVLCLFDLFGFT